MSAWHELHAVYLSIFIIWKQTFYGIQTVVMPLRIRVQFRNLRGPYPAYDNYSSFSRF